MIQIEASDACLATKTTYLKSTYMDTTDKDNKSMTRERWHTIGFFYKLEREKRLWYFAGSKTGLHKLYTILANYANNEQYNEQSEHEHYGPYMYLEIMTWERPGIDAHSIHGSKEDIKRLSDIFISKLEEAAIGEQFVISHEYTLDADYSILVEVKEDGFDPALLDI